MLRRWLLRESDAEARERISRASGVSGLTAAVLAARGFAGSEEVQAFLSPSLGALPDPSLLPGMDRAAARLTQAARGGESVWVYTDYDVDGVTSAALLGEFFQACGIPVQTWLPRRDREGYGLHADALREMAAQGGRVVVTADCGINAVAEARLARELGVDLIVTDHHTPGNELPQALAVVNPKLPGCAYPEPMLAGVGVAWNLAAAVRRRLRDAGWFSGRPEPDVRHLLDLVALGTVADMAPLTGVNRVLVAGGLARLNGPGRRPGLRALLRAMGLQGDDAISAGRISFQLGPRLNASGRMASADRALALLLGTGPEAALEETARTLHELNEDRRREEARVLDAARAVVERGGWLRRGAFSLVVAGEGWHEGVIGIVASRLAETYHRPSVVIALDGASGTAKGSARSIRGFDLYGALAQCAGVLERFGGHRAAAGLGVAPERIGAFREAFEQAARRALDDEDLIPALAGDGEARFGELTLASVRELERLEPFGVGNPAPVLVSRGVTVLDARDLGGKGVLLRLEQEGRRFSGKKWLERRGAEPAGPAAPTLAARAGELSGRTVDVAYVPEARTWRGQSQVELSLRGLRAAGSRLEEPAEELLG
ncbi:MAG: single-stranded-DNA-specific exonuclease RecJ [Thermodesulfobacteriota bacterium]